MSKTSLVWIIVILCCLLIGAIFDSYEEKKRADYFEKQFRVMEMVDKFNSSAKPSK